MTTEAMRAAFEAWRETQPWYIVCKDESPAALMNMAARSAWECATLAERERCAKLVVDSVKHTRLECLEAIRNGETP